MVDFLLFTKNKMNNNYVDNLEYSMGKVALKLVQN